jgi:hypothetical protein
MIGLCDDYGGTTCPEATEAIDGFLAGKPEKMIGLDAAPAIESAPVVAG